MKEQEEMIELTLDEAINSIRQIWSMVLKCKNIGENDHFLDLGGDSLDAMRCVSRISTDLGVELAFHDFFLDDATIKRQALLVMTELNRLRQKD